jgi:hypothetical protein
VNFEKSAYVSFTHSFPSTPWQSKKTCPKFLDFTRLVYLIWAFRQITQEVDLRKPIFDFRRKLGEVSLNWNVREKNESNLKKIITTKSSIGMGKGNFFLYLSLTNLLNK